MIVSVVLKNPFQPSSTFLLLCLVKKSLRAGLTKRRSPLAGSPNFEGVPSTGTVHTGVRDTKAVPEQMSFRGWKRKMRSPGCTAAAPALPLSSSCWVMEPQSQETSSSL